LLAFGQRGKQFQQMPALLDRFVHSRILIDGRDVAVQRLARGGSGPKAKKLDAIITLVDAVNGNEQLDTLEEPVKQAAVADRLVSTKTDLADPDEVAAVALFLVSDAASYVSGAIIPMDGCAASVI
jgi:NAD(P)-dependent dehydrogenase (short-subunit alcohol dehydrogenase family)